MHSDKITGKIVYSGSGPLYNSTKLLESNVEKCSYSHKLVTHFDLTILLLRDLWFGGVVVWELGRPEYKS